MNKIIFRRIQFIMIVALVAWIIIGCRHDYITKGGGSSDVASCEACHTDYTLLKEVYTPDTAPPPGGCGGEAPHYEPYDRVYMGGDNYEAFKATSHYPLGCTFCHNGNDESDDKATAHSGDFIRHPSMYAADKCSGCHPDIVADAATSLHHGTGQKRKMTMRSGLAGPEEFDLLPQHKIDGYNANCATCHGTCGNCHVVRPPIAGGGLAKAHNFIKTPDMLNTCISCHTSRGGHAYLGRDPNADPDIHLTQAGFQCIDCHTGAEIHGNGEEVNHRYAYSELPTCTSAECHEGLESANNYHNMHYDDFNCQVCHSQDYNTCGSCHIHGDGARFGPYQDFKIALNPIKADRPEFDFALVRRNLAAPDNWEVYNVPDYENFDVFPTYNYTTPHNIQRWTSRTNEGGSCSVNCHIRNDGGNLINVELFLWTDSLEIWEVDATSSICVDGQLPSGWFTK